MSTSLEETRQLLVSSQLFASDEVSARLDEWNGQVAEADRTSQSFINWLVDQELITDFQGEAISEGHAGPFMLGPYEVHEHVAHGWLGGIFRAVHKEFNQPVSLKIFVGKVTADAERFARMGRELRIACELDHPNLVRTFDVGEAGDLSYLALEDLQGETLADRLAREGPLPYEEACRIGRDLANGLASLHDQGIVLRDIRPENIWLTSEGVAKLMEFGGAKDALGFLDTEAGGTEVSTFETIIGEYAYMSPEQATDVRGADARSDIYSLGCVLYHCLAGRPPFESKNNVKLMMMHTNQPPQPVSELIDGLPQAIDDTLAGMLAKAPDDRFGTAQNVSYALDQYVSKKSEQPMPVVELNEQYLAWAKSRHPSGGGTISDDAVGITPELTNFLSWIGAKKR